MGLNFDFKGLNYSGNSNSTDVNKVQNMSNQQFDSSNYFDSTRNNVNMENSGGNVQHAPGEIDSQTATVNILSSMCKSIAEDMGDLKKKLSDMFHGNNYNKIEDIECDDNMKETLHELDEQVSSKKEEVKDLENEIDIIKNRLNNNQTMNQNTGTSQPTLVSYDTFMYENSLSTADYNELQRLQEELNQKQQELAVLEQMYYNFTLAAKQQKYDDYASSTEYINYNFGDISQEALAKNDAYKYISENYKYLTEDEIKMYVFLQSTGKLDDANEYLQVIEDSVNKQIGTEKAIERINKLKFKDEEEAAKYFDAVIRQQNGEEVDMSDLDPELVNGIGNILTVLGTGVADGVVTHVEGYGNWFKDGTVTAREYERSIYASYLSQFGELVDGVSGYEKLYSFSSSTGNMLIPMAESTIATVITKNPELGKDIATIDIAWTSGGNAYHGALSSGNSTTASLLYGILSGLSESSLERLLGSMPRLGNVDGSYIKKILSEAAEEGLQQLIDEEVLSPLLKGEAVDLDTLGADCIEAFMSGLLMAALFNGGQNSIQVVSNGVNYVLSGEVIIDYYSKHPNATLAEIVTYIRTQNNNSSLLDDTYLSQADKDFLAEHNININDFYDSDKVKAKELYNDIINQMSDLESKRHFYEIFTTSFALQSEWNIAEVYAKQKYEMETDSTGKLNGVDSFYNLSVDEQNRLVKLAVEELSNMDKNGPDYAALLANYHTVRIGFSEQQIAKIHELAENNYLKITEEEVFNLLYQDKANFKASDIFTDEYLEKWKNSLNIDENGEFKVVCFQSADKETHSVVAHEGNIGPDDGPFVMTYDQYSKLLSNPEIFKQVGDDYICINAAKLYEATGGVKVGTTPFAVIQTLNVNNFDIYDLFAYGGNSNAYIGEWIFGGFTSGGIAELCVPQNNIFDSNGDVNPDVEIVSHNTTYNETEIYTMANEKSK